MGKGTETRALVIRGTNYGESDRIVTLLTERFGKMRGIAKGARRSLKRFGGCLEPFTLLNLVVREGRGLHLIEEGKGLRSFRGIKEDIGRISYASYLLELTDALLHDDDGTGGQELFPCLLAGLEEIEGARSPETAAREYEIRLLGKTGYMPSLLSCTGCGEGLLAAEDPLPAGADFSTSRGGILCRACAGREERGLFHVSLGTLRTLDSAVRGKAAFTRAALEESGRMVNAFIAHQLGGRRLKSLDFIEQVKGL